MSCKACPALDLRCCLAGRALWLWLLGERCGPRFQSQAGKLSPWKASGRLEVPGTDHALHFSFSPSPDPCLDLVQLYSLREAQSLSA